jgi:hypothetical protein
MQYARTLLLSHILRISPRNSDTLETFNVRTIFETKCTLFGTLTKTGPVRGAQQTNHCVYNIPCDCGRCYISEVIRPLEVCIKEQKQNLTQGLIEKSKLVKHVYEEGHKICSEEVKVLQIEPNSTYRKYKLSAHVSLVDHPISQPSLDISPIWTPFIAAEVRELQLCPV